MSKTKRLADEKFDSGDRNADFELVEELIESGEL